MLKNEGRRYQHLDILYVINLPFCGMECICIATSFILRAPKIQQKIIIDESIKKTILRWRTKFVDPIKNLPNLGKKRKHENTNNKNQHCAKNLESYVEPDLLTFLEHLKPTPLFVGFVLLSLCSTMFFLCTIVCRLVFFN